MMRVIHGEEDDTKLPPKLRKNLLASNKCKGTEISQIKNLTKCFWSHQPQALEKIPLTEKKSGITVQKIDQSTHNWT